MHDDDKGAVHHLMAVCLDGMGDVLMTTPALRALRPVADRITLLTSSAGALLGPHLAEVDGVLRYDASWVRWAAASVEQDWHAIRRVSGLLPDAAVIFTAQGHSALPMALMLRLAGVPRVLAYSREDPHRLLSDWVQEREPGRQAHPASGRAGCRVGGGQCLCVQQQWARSYRSGAAGAGGDV